jgi:hypothetical protein
VWRSPSLRFPEDWAARSAYLKLLASRALFRHGNCRIPADQPPEHASDAFILSPEGGIPPLPGLAGSWGTAYPALPRRAIQMRLLRSRFQGDLLHRGAMGCRQPVWPGSIYPVRGCTFLQNIERSTLDEAFSPGVAAPMEPRSRRERALR